MTATSAKWIERAPNDWRLYLQYPDGSDPLSHRASAMVCPSRNDEGKWFWEHWPYMGEYGTAESLDEAKKIAGCQWKSLLAAGDTLDSENSHAHGRD